MQRVLLGDYKRSTRFIQTIRTPIKMFADDCKNFRILNTDGTSPESFQNDLKKLTDWVNTRSLELVFSKCKVIHFG